MVFEARRMEEEAEKQCKEEAATRHVAELREEREAAGGRSDEEAAAVGDRRQRQRRLSRRKTKIQNRAYMGVWRRARRQDLWRRGMPRGHPRRHALLDTPRGSAPRSAVPRRVTSAPT